MKVVNKTKWWLSIEDNDPITLEPIKSLRKEPYLLGKKYFDCETLAHYLVSTAVFVNPATREPLTKDDCRKIDCHLQTIRAKPARVEEAYELFHSNNVGQKKEISDRLRREATVLFHQLFTYHTKREEIRQQHQRNRNRGSTNNKKSGKQQLGVVVYDDDEDEWENDFDYEQIFNSFDLNKDFPELYQLPGSSAVMTSTSKNFTKRLARPAPRGGRQPFQPPGRFTAQAINRSQQREDEDDEDDNTFDEDNYPMDNEDDDDDEVPLFIKSPYQSSTIKTNDGDDSPVKTSDDDKEAELRREQEQDQLQRERLRIKEENKLLRRINKKKVKPISPPPIADNNYQQLNTTNEMETSSKPYWGFFLLLLLICGAVYWGNELTKKIPS